MPSPEGHGEQDKHDMLLQYYKNCTKARTVGCQVSVSVFSEEREVCSRRRGRKLKRVQGGVDTKLESVQGGVGAILSARAPTNTCTAVTRNQSTKTAINACRYIHQRCKAIDPKD